MVDGIIAVAQWSTLLLVIISLVFLNLEAECVDVGITYVRKAVADGAVCLDGSPPAYHFDEGFGAGLNNWLVHFEGGGWCNNVSSCVARRDTRLGSSKQMLKVLSFSGILSNNQTFNPDFYNWNRIRVRYCDGASYTGDVEEVDPTTKLHFRGARIFVAVIEDLLAKGMKDAENAVISGCSAGGLTSILHCDNFRSLLPPSTIVKCLSDAGYFINAKDISGARHIEEFFSQVVATHGSTKNLPTSCTSRMEPCLCFFPQNVVEQISTPLFILNAAYDSWQINNILVPGVADPHGIWHRCKLDITKCSSDQLKLMQEFRQHFLRVLPESASPSLRGMFIDACYVHCQSELQETWFRIDSSVINNTSVAEAVGDWYYERTMVQNIDCAYPCNPTCHNGIN